MKTVRVASVLLAVAAFQALPASAEDEDLAYLSANMFARYVPPPGGEEGALGAFSAEIDFSSGQMCYFLEAEDLPGVTEAHIHEGAEGKPGGEALVTLKLSSDDLCEDVNTALMRKILKKPESYYIDIHSETHPRGAVRGQLTG